MPRGFRKGSKVWVPVGRGFAPGKIVSFETDRRGEWAVAEVKRLKDGKFGRAGESYTVRRRVYQLHRYGARLGLGDAG